MTLRSVVQPLRIDSIEFYVTAKGLVLVCPFTSTSGHLVVAEK